MSQSSVCRSIIKYDYVIIGNYYDPEFFILFNTMKPDAFQNMINKQTSNMWMHTHNGCGRLADRQIDRPND